MNFTRVKEFFMALIERLGRMKAERVQNPIVATEVAMTDERIQNRVSETAVELISAPVAIRQRYSFANFAEASGFVHREIGRVAAKLGHPPMVEIYGKTVTLTLGVPVPNLLTEGDFDFVAEIGQANDEPQTEPVADAA